MKNTFFCNICQIKTYLFNIYFLVTFDLEKILKKKQIQILNVNECFAIQNTTFKIKEINCSKCLNKTQHTC